MIWYDVKRWLVDVMSLDKDALHIYIAVAIQLVTAVLLRRSLASLWPWLAALTAALLNEYVDYQGVGETAESVAIYRAAAWHDMWNTMLLPTLLFGLARFWPGLLSNRVVSGSLIDSAKRENPD